jgi:cell pole-organizing protein PopZ
MAAGRRLRSRPCPAPWPRERGDTLEVSDVTTEQREQPEPSMEEILSSIRRIIADEEAEGADDPNAAAEEGSDAVQARDETFDGAHTFDNADEDDETDDVLELTKVVRESGEVVDLKAETADGARFDVGAPDMVEDQDEAVLTPPDDESEREPGTMADEHINREDRATVHTKQSRAEELISMGAATAASGSIVKLTSAFRTPAEESVADADGRTIEQFAEDLLRPVLKEWLDEHLPPLIERIVEKEIRKIARRAEAL